jgi:NAD(P)-dependent dehydrogenase (short-subunit alcohol dehydrogenase family)
MYKYMENLKDKVIIITGAADGIGLATAMEAAKSGAILSLVDFNEFSLIRAKESILAKYPETKLLTIAGDVTDIATAINYTQETVTAFGRIDGLYNNAGIVGISVPIDELDPEVFNKTVNVNLNGVFYGLRSVIPVMKKQKYGRIVNAASVAGLRGVLNSSAYVSTKHAVAGLTKTAAIEVAASGISVNAIAPGAILTAMMQDFFNQKNPENPKQAELEFANNNPTKRLGLPEEVAKLVVFLLSESCSYVNGQIIAIDGGQSNGYVS